MTSNFGSSDLGAGEIDTYVFVGAGRLCRRPSVYGCLRHGERRGQRAVPERWLRFDRRCAHRATRRHEHGLSRVAPKCGAGQGAGGARGRACRVRERRASAMAPARRCRRTSRRRQGTARRCRLHAREQFASSSTMPNAKSPKGKPRRARRKAARRKASRIRSGAERVRRRRASARSGARRSPKRALPRLRRRSIS